MDYNGLTPLLAAGVDTDGISSFLLTDNRDNKTYKVRRLAEGKCHMVHPEGFEPTTSCSEDKRSNPLSYGCNKDILSYFPSFMLQ